MSIAQRWNGTSACCTAGLHAVVHGFLIKHFFLKYVTRAWTYMYNFSQKASNLLELSLKQDEDELHSKLPVEQHAEPSVAPPAKPPR